MQSDDRMQIAKCSCMTSACGGTYRALASRQLASTNQLHFTSVAECTRAVACYSNNHNCHERRVHHALLVRRVSWTTEPPRTECAQESLFVSNTFVCLFVCFVDGAAVRYIRTNSVGRLAAAPPPTPHIHTWINKILRLLYVCSNCERNGM